MCAHGGLQLSNENILFNQREKKGCALEELHFNVSVHFPQPWKMGKQRTSAKRHILTTGTREISDIQRLCALHYRWSAQSFIRGACVAFRVMALLTEMYQIVVVVTDSFSACQKYQPGQRPYLSKWNSIFTKKRKEKKMESFLMWNRKRMWGIINTEVKQLFFLPLGCDCSSNKHCWCKKWVQIH